MSPGLNRLNWIKPDIVVEIRVVDFEMLPKMPTYKFRVNIIKSVLEYRSFLIFIFLVIFFT